MKTKKNRRPKGFSYNQLIKAYHIMKSSAIDICGLCGGMNDRMCNDNCPEYQRKYKERRRFI